jgi:hypothetical protein
MKQWLLRNHEIPIRASFELKKCSQTEFWAGKVAKPWLRTACFVDTLPNFFGPPPPLVATET